MAAAASIQAGNDDPPNAGGPPERTHRGQTRPRGTNRTGKRCKKWGPDSAGRDLSVREGKKGESADLDGERKVKRANTASPAPYRATGANGTQKRGTRFRAAASVGDETNE